MVPPTMTTGTLGELEAAGQVAFRPEEAISLYNVDRWGLGYITVNDQGNVSVRPRRESSGEIDVMKAIEAAREQGLGFPLVLRFQDLLRDRVERLNEAFRAGILDTNYKGRYRGVFPIKVNQLREVVEEIVDAGRPFDFGIEAGSKPELMAALAVHDNPESLIICNGYKDTRFIRLALLGTRLGKKVIMVAEKPEEVRAIMAVGRDMGVEPWIGIRVRLASKSSGMWALSGGENAKFGLSTVDLLEAVDYLESQGLLHCLKLIHFHIGSQIPDIQSIKQATREGTRHYAKLKQMGCDGLQYLDVGGGLGVDYDGSRTNFLASTNYTLEEYAADIVFNVGDVCDEEEVAHPDIVSESGRAIVAHHSMLVLQVFGAISKRGPASAASRATEDDHKYVRQLDRIRSRVQINPMESLHDALQIKSEAQKAFELGFLGLRTKARVEATYWDTCMEILEYYRRTPRDPREGIPEEIQELEAATANQYVCNFSVFQSLMDHWALGQLFPIMPLHRLTEVPDQQGTLVDITCDSDGKISKFTDLRATRESLQCHSLRAGEPYYLGIFMTGAYQDIMGDLHNLFGRANEAHVFLDEDEEEGWYIEETIEGHSIGQVLGMTQYDPNALARRMKQIVDEAIRSNRVKPAEGMRLLAEYEKTMQESTYLSL